MVTTLSPNASDTPTRPIPTCGKPAAMTALPHPANVSQNVPISSAAYFLVSMETPPRFVIAPLPLVENKPESSQISKWRPARHANLSVFPPPYRTEIWHQRWTFHLLSDT